MKVLFPIDYCSFVCNDFFHKLWFKYPEFDSSPEKNEFSMFYLGLNYAGLDIIAKKMSWLRLISNFYKLFLAFFHFWFNE